MVNTHYGVYGDYASPLALALAVIWCKMEQQAKERAAPWSMPNNIEHQMMMMMMMMMTDDKT